MRNLFIRNIFEFIIAFVAIIILFLIYPFLLFFFIISGEGVKDKISELNDILLDVIASLLVFVEKVCDFIFRIFIK